MAALGDRTSLKRGQHNCSGIRSLSLRLAFLFMCCNGLSVCWQFVTRWPLTQASQAYFSPLINILLLEVGRMVVGNVLGKWRCAIGCRSG